MIGWTNDDPAMEGREAVGAKAGAPAGWRLIPISCSSPSQRHVAGRRIAELPKFGDTRISLLRTACQ